MNTLIEKLLSEVDKDIADAMLSAGDGSNREYKKWQLLNDPALTILAWQELRDRRKHESSS